MALFKRRSPLSAEERAERIAAARAADTAEGVRCPSCGVHTPGLKGRRPGRGATSMPGLSDAWAAAQTRFTMPDQARELATPQETKGGKLRTYHCPVCEHWWTAG